MSEFGGDWTKQKLDILERYLTSYLNVFTRMRDYFTLIYIDAFAGDGEIKINSSEGEEFIDGSVKRVLSMKEKIFDEFVFIEINSDKIKKLEDIKNQYPNKQIKIFPNDANLILKDLCRDTDWKKRRAVLFLDPFATEVEWTTIEAVAATEAIDVWFLFPIEAIERTLPINRKPPEEWHSRLNRIFGNNDWEDLYSPKATLFGYDENERQQGSDEIKSLYVKQLKSIYGNRFLGKSKSLYTDNNRIIFEFMFAAGSPKGKRIAHKIAAHLIDNI